LRSPELVGDRIPGGATLVVPVSLFLPWYSANLAGLKSLGVAGGEDVTASGTTAQRQPWFVFVMVLIMLLYPAVAVGYQRIPYVLPLKHERVPLAATGMNLSLVFVTFLLKLGNDGITEVNIGEDFDAFIALIAAITAAVPLTWAAVTERTAIYAA
jgi:hypothetical protein